MSDEQFGGSVSGATGAGSEGTPPVAPPAPTSGSTPIATGGTQPASEQLVEIKWRGRVEQVPLSRAIELAQQGYDYTQKTQSLADKERQYQAQVAQYEQTLGQIKEFLLDKARVQQYLAELAKGDPLAGTAPDEPVTAQQLQDQWRQYQQQLQQSTTQQLAQMRQQLEIDQLASQYERDLGTTIQGLRDKFPELKAIPRLDRILKEEVAERNPRSLDEAKSLMLEIAQSHAQALRAQFAREAVAPPAASLARGIEPPGGSGPLPPPEPNMSMKDPRFKEAVMRDLMQAAAERNR